MNVYERLKFGLFNGARMSTAATTAAPSNSSVKDKHRASRSLPFITDNFLFYYIGDKNFSVDNLVSFALHGRYSSVPEKRIGIKTGLSLYYLVEDRTVRQINSLPDVIAIMEAKLTRCKTEPDWSLEDVDCVLHWIAGGTISERKGTELLNVIFGKSLSRYTVRSKVKALKEKERVSATANIDPKENDDNDNELQYRIVEVESENGDVKTYTELMNFSASCSDVTYENGDTCEAFWSTDVYDLSTKEETNISKVEIIRLLNRRGNLGLIAIAENDGYRVYRQSTKQATRAYYRCSRCDWLKKKNGAGRTAYITMVNDSIVGTAYPLHNELCQLYTQSALRMKQFDRETKKEVLQNVKEDEDLKVDEESHAEVNVHQPYQGGHKRSQYWHNMYLQERTFPEYIFAHFGGPASFEQSCTLPPKEEVCVVTNTTGALTSKDDLKKVLNFVILFLLYTHSSMYEVEKRVEIRLLSAEIRTEQGIC
uniref:Transposase n=1 Tax=Setaria digitata TaxID=48799 RepID=A0A915PVG3_9BILA